MLHRPTATSEARKTTGSTGAGALTAAPIEQSDRGRRFPGRVENRGSDVNRPRRWRRRHAVAAGQDEAPKIRSMTAARTRGFRPSPSPLRILRSPTASSSSTRRSPPQPDDGMPALGVSDLANLFGMVSSTRAPRQGIKPIVGVTPGSERGRARQRPHLLLLVCRNRAGYGAVRTADRACLGRTAAVPRSRRSFARRGGEALLSPVGGNERRHRAAIGAARQPRARRTARRRLGAAVSRQLYRDPACRAPSAGQRHPFNVGGPRRPGSACRWWRPTRSVPPSARTSRRTRPGVCIAQGYVLADKRRPRDFTRNGTFRARRRWPSSSPTCPRRSRTRSRSRAAASLSVNSWAKNPAGSRPRGHERRRLLVAEAKKGLEERLSSSTRTRRSASSSARATSSGSEVRDRHHHPDGLPRLLPDRGRLHPVGQEQRRAGRSRARLRRGLAGGLFAQDHRPRPLRTRCCSSASSTPSACRCPTSTSTSARTRYRVIEYVRERYGKGRGEPDRHLRHHGGEGGGPRRRPRARPALRPVSTGSPS